MKLECVDLMNPEFIYKATVNRLFGRLLKV